MSVHVCAIGGYRNGIHFPFESSFGLTLNILVAMVDVCELLSPHLVIWRVHERCLHRRVIRSFNIQIRPTGNDVPLLSIEPLDRLRHNRLLQREPTHRLALLSSRAITCGILIAIILSVGTAGQGANHLRAMLVSALVRQAARCGLVVVVVIGGGVMECGHIGFYTVVAIVNHAAVLASSSDALPGCAQACSVLGFAHPIRSSRVLHLGTCWLIVSAQSQRSLKQCVRVIRIEVRLDHESAIGGR